MAKTTSKAAQRRAAGGIRRGAVLDAGGNIVNTIVLGDEPFVVEGFHVVEDPDGKGKIGGHHDREKGEFRDPPDRPEPPNPPTPQAAGSPGSSKVDLWERATDEEAVAIMAALDAAPPKVRMVWQDSLTIDPNGPRFKEIRALIRKAVGTKKRADELLAMKEE